MKNLLYAVSLLLVVGCTPTPDYERPREMWVFRSVLDEQPRMLSAALHDDLWVAYDVERALLQKSWKGGVKFDGAVYTTVHGPQPTSEGYAFYDLADRTDQWMLLGAQGGEITPKVDYNGHRFVDGQVILSYDLITPEGERIGFSETPEYLQRGNQTGLSRTFAITNPTDHTPVLKTAFSSLINEADYSTTGTVEMENLERIEYADGFVLDISGKVFFDQPQTTIKTFYHPGFDKLGASMTGDSEPEESVIPAGALLIEQGDCETCHNEKLKTVGPAYITVAQRYSDSEETVELLASKVIEGGQGVWGEALMTAHPDLMEVDAKEMVRYILSLDDDDEEGAAEKYTLGEKAVPIKLADTYSGGVGPGFMAHAFINLLDEPISEVIKRDPVKQGPVSVLHALGTSFFDEFREDFVMKFDGKLEIARTGSYAFRLISDDGSFLYIDDKLVIDNGGSHGPRPMDGEVYLTEGSYDIEIRYQQGGGGAVLSLQWFNRDSESFELVDASVVSYEAGQILPTKPYIPPGQLTKGIPGDVYPLEKVHPSFDLFQARPDDFNPRVGGIDFFSDGRMAVCTWDSLGPVYLIDGWQSGDPSKMSVKRIASGLAEPLGLKIVDDELYVLQKQELTRLIDHDGDDVIDEYRTVSDDWKVSANFHEFAFGLAYKDGHFYGALATAILPGGASADPQIPDRGKVVRINKENGATELIAHGLRTPNGIGLGFDGQLFIADNQGDWLPSSKIVHIEEDNWYGSRSVDFEGTADLEETLPVVWLPQDEIGNSPSTPLGIEIGPYAGQLIHGEVTHGGIKRVFAEEVDGRLQGAVFRFTQGLEAGINRIAWAPDGSLIVGGVGSTGNWGHTGKSWYGLQRLKYNQGSTFEMLSVSARTDGFEIEFTEPIADGQYLSAEDFQVQRFYYQPTEAYGGPKLDLTTVSPLSLRLSADRKKVFLELAEMRANHVFYVRIVRPFSSENGRELWSTEAWYTLNRVPGDKPGFTEDFKTVHNTLTDAEKDAGWKLLFDGRTTEGIRNFKSQDLGRKWVAQNGTLHFRGKGSGDGWQASDGGDVIITDKPYENYELYLEWKVAPGGNSGIIYNVIESDKYDYVWQTGPEMQILDNLRHADGQIEKHRAGDLYDLISCKFVTAGEVGTWNRVRLIVNNGRVEHWLNGYKVVETEMWTEAWDAMVAKSKFRDMPDFGTGRSGHIALQDHGDKVWFRNIKIREL